MLVDTGSIPHSVLPLKLFHEHQQDINDSYEDIPSTAVLADSTTSVQLHGYVTLKLSLVEDGVTHSGDVRFAIMDTRGAILGLVDILVLFGDFLMTIFRKSQLDLGVKPTVCVVDALRPEEWPPRLYLLILLIYVRVLDPRCLPGPCRSMNPPLKIL